MALFAARVGAYLGDMLLLFVVFGPAGLLVQSLTGLRPETGPEIWLFLLATFSLPSWLYFVLCESGAGGATVGKRLAGLQVRTVNGGRIGPGRSLVRTAVKLLPWELVHWSAFGLSSSLQSFSPRQTTGLALAWVLLAAWLISAARSGGRASIHDRLAGTEVTRAARAPVDS